MSAIDIKATAEKEMAAPQDGQKNTLQKNNKLSTSNSDETPHARTYCRLVIIGVYFLPKLVIEQAGEIDQKYAAELMQIECERREA